MESPCEAIIIFKKSWLTEALELKCVLSANLQTKAVKSPSEYPIREFLNTGLKVSINTDNRTVSNTSLTKRASVHSGHVWHSGGRDTANDEECSGYGICH